MKSAHAIALVLALGWLAAGERAGSQEASPDEAPVEPPAPGPIVCPVVEGLKANPRRFEYPALATSIDAAEYVAPDGSRQPGTDGKNETVRMIIDSLRPGCVPIRLVSVIGAADFDSRGDQFQDHMSIERALKARLEIAQAFDAAFQTALAAGEIRNLPIRLVAGGIGARSPVVPHPTTEPERKQNRFVALRLVQFEEPPASTDTAIGESGDTAAWLDGP